MRDDVIHQIAELSNIDHVVVLTHNIDFVFLQTVFLSALKKCGHPGLTVFADAQCAQESYRVQSSMISGLGRRYRVVPVSMNAGYRFHPKAVFLVGADQAVLFIGSGNLTFGGMRANVEIWNRFDVGQGDGQSIAAFQEYLHGLSGRVAFEESKKAELAELFDPRNRRWVEKLDEPAGLIGRIGKSMSLASQMRRLLGDEPVLSITVSAPYFDPSAEALKAISSEFSDTSIEVLIQSGRSTLFSEAAKSLPGNIALKSVSFSSHEKDDGEDRRFIHAKYYAFHRPNAVDVFAGSANCSKAALLKDGSEGNAELMVHQTMDVAMFEEQFLNEHTVTELPPELASRDDAEPDDVVASRIRILAASFDVNTVRVAYESSKGVELRSCQVGETETDYEIINQSEILVRTVNPPRSVELKGMFDGQGVISNRIWVDDESSLRSSSKGRALLERIRNTDSSNPMQMEDWALIVELFAKDLDYTTARQAAKRKSEGEAEETGKTSMISRSDVFSNAYDKAPDFSSRLSNSLGAEGANIYSLLLNAFGLTSGEESAVKRNEGDEGTVPTPVSRKKKQALKLKGARTTDRSRKRISKVLDAITSSFTDDFYLEFREPERLGTDLQIAGLVLRKALSEGWIDDRRFFDVTQKIWSILFFSASKDKSEGWLGIRLDSSKDKSKFVLAMSSPQLAATLFSWATAIDTDAGGAYTQRFLASLLMSMGRFPWLWHDGLDQEALYTHLFKILNDSPCKVDDTVEIESLHRRRIALLRQGVALVEMEKALNASGVSELRSQLRSNSAEKGEVLWQGRRGVCIALESTAQSGQNTRVLCLQDPEGDTAFVSEFLMPVRELLDPDVLPVTKEFGEAQRHAVVLAMRKFSTIEAQPPKQ